MAKRTHPFYQLNYSNPYRTSQKKRKVLETELFQTLRPLPGSDPDKDSSITFELRVGPQQFIRFLPNPISMTYRLSYDDSGTETYMNNNTKLILDPLIAGANFFENATVRLDQHEVTTTPSLGNHQIRYQRINRMLCKSSTRKKLYGDSKLFWTAADLLEQYPDATASADEKKAKKIPPYFSKAKGLISGRGTNNTKANYDLRYLEFSMDGYPFIGKPRNNAGLVLDGLSPTGPENEFPLLPPDTLVQVQLFKDPHPCRFLTRTDKNMADYQKKDVFTEKYKDIKLEILDIHLRYEVISIGDNGKKALNEKLSSAKSLKFGTDQVVSTVYNLQQGHNTAVVEADVPAGTKLCVWSFAKDHGVYLSSTTKKYCNPYSVLPQNLSSVTFSLPGDEPINFKNGIKDLVGLTTARSPSVRMYHDMLEMKEVIDDDFEDIYTDNEADPGLNNVFLIDLSKKNIKTPIKLKVEVNFKDTATAHDLGILHSIVDSQISRNQFKEWSRTSGADLD